MARRPMRPKRHTPSSVDRLDPEVRELIANLRIDKGWTIDEIRAQLIKMGQSDVPSRSALGRHIRTLPDMISEMREVETLASAMAKEMGDKTESDLLSLNRQMISTSMFKLMLAEKDGEAIQLGAQETKYLAEALRALTQGRKTEVETVEKIEARAAAKATKESAEKATTAARNQGLSKETVDAIRFAVLGSDG